MAIHTVKQGECIESIAFENGLFWEVIWDDPNNAQLKQKRKDHNALMPGDEVFIPEKREKTVECQTEKIHRFRRKGVPSKLDVILKRQDKPLANEPYVLDIDGSLFSGTTNSKGQIEQNIPPNAKSGKLTVGKDPDTEEYELFLGHVNPFEEVTGAQIRLNNLGFSCGDPDGKMTPRTVAAVKAFQEREGLKKTGEIDPETMNAIKEKHGS